MTVSLVGEQGRILNNTTTQRNSDRNLVLNSVQSANAINDGLCDALGLTYGAWILFPGIMMLQWGAALASPERLKSD